MTTDIKISNTPYLPDYAELTAAQLEGARERLVTFIASRFPDLDTRPNSIFGDLFIAPASYIVAALEVALGRFASDLDLENVSQGVIYNCDFVEKYLGNFAIYERETLQASGILRLVFNTDAAVTVDRGTRFQFGDDVFNLFLPYDGPLKLLPVGSPQLINENYRVFSEIAPGTYAVDLPVTGAMTTAVVSGNAPNMDRTVAGLSSAQAIIDFNFGTPPTSLAKLAERTRRTFYAASLNTRGGIEKFVEKEFPDITGKSAVLTGDNEMMRDVVNPLGFRDGRVDFYALSPGYIFSSSQQVRLSYNISANKFVGELALPSRPYLIESITPVNSTVAINFNILSESKDYARAPLASAAYSELERLWLVVDMPTGNGGNLLIPDVDVAGNQYLYFDVTYKADPLLKAIVSALDNPDINPGVLDILTKGFIPIVIDRFEVHYIREPGTQMKLDQATKEISEYLGSLAWPSIYTDARIYDAMYYANAKDIKEIVIQAHVQWSVADLFLPVGTTTPTADVNGAIAAGVTANAISLTDSRSLKPSYTDPDLITMEAIGPRNVFYVLKDNALTFIEEKS
jgi:hypothetical protein